MLKIERAFQIIRDVFVILIMTTGLILAPAPPAIILSVAVAASLNVIIGGTWSIIVGVTLGLILEAAGVTSAHTAIKFYNDGERDKFYISAVVSTLYILVGISSILLFDTNPVIRIAGVVAYLVAPMIYVSTALLSDAQKVEDIGDDKRREARAAAKERRLFKREQERRAQAHQFELEKLRITAAPVTVAAPTNGYRENFGAVDSDRFQIFLSEIQKNPTTLHNISALSRATSISRPTLMKYIKLYKEQDHVID